MPTWLTRFSRFNSKALGLSLTCIVLLLFWLDETHQTQKPFAVALLHRLELLASDLRFRVRGTMTPGPEVVIAAIDEQSVDELGRWPWPYTVQAQLIRRLTSYGAAAIGYDVVFSSSDTSAGLDNLQAIDASLAARGYYHDAELKALLDKTLAAADHDRLFATALQESDRTILGYFFHWQRQDVAHLPESELERSLHNLTVSKNARYTPRVEPGASLGALHVSSAYAVESNLPILSQAVWGNGFFNSRPDTDDGVIRYYPLIVQYRGDRDAPVEPGRDAAAPAQQAAVPGKQNDLFAPLGIRLLERYLHERHGNASTLVSIGADQKIQVWLVAGRQRFAIPVDEQGRMIVNHLGPSELAPRETTTRRQYRFPRYAIADIVQGRETAAPPEAFRNKIVLIGATAVGLADQRVTPFDPAFPGVETHATVIDNILRQRFLVVPWWGSWCTGANIALVGIGLMLLLPRLSALRGNIATTLVILGHVGLNYALFVTQGWMLSIVYPLLATFVVWLGMTIYHFVFEQKRSRFLRRTFSTYLSPELVTIMVRDGIEPRLGGSSGTRTAYFTDIASFSSFSEVLSATQLVELLNEYLSVMTDILVAEGGTLDKYEGDAIVAFFGAPIEYPDHAARAVRVALKMQRALAQLREKWHAEGDKWPTLVRQMRMRIGISSGEIVTGNMGSTMRMNYTMMGDVVNTAARLEAAAKQYGVYILCTAETLQLAGLDDFAWRVIDKVKVVGKSEAIETVEIMAYKGQLPPEQVQMRALYQQGVELYRQQQWDEATARFTESEKLEDVFPRRPTTPSRVYIERCELLKANPPGPHWDGSWTLTSK
jgi:adenylate cyclase